MNVDWDIDRLTHGRQHLKLDVAYRIDRICPDLLDQFCRTWIAVSGMCRQFKLAVCRNLTGPACLIQYPQAAFIVHDKMAAAKVGPATEAIATIVAFSPTPLPKWRLG